MQWRDLSQTLRSFHCITDQFRNLESHSEYTNLCTQREIKID